MVDAQQCKHDKCSLMKVMLKLQCELRQWVTKSLVTIEHWARNLSLLAMAILLAITNECSWQGHLSEIDSDRICGDPRTWREAWSEASHATSSIAVPENGTQTIHSMFLAHFLLPLIQPFLPITSLTLKPWHRCLGHISTDTIVSMAHSNIVQGMPIYISFAPPKCNSCVLGKQTRASVPKLREGIQATRPLECVSLDLCRPMSVATRSGHLYSMNFDWWLCKLCLESATLH